MPDDLKIEENVPNPESSSLPQSPQVQPEPASIPDPISTPSEMPSSELGASNKGFDVKSTNIPPSESNLMEQENAEKSLENQSENKSNSGPISEPADTQAQTGSSEAAGTAQIPVNEPLENKENKPFMESEQAKPAREESKVSLAREWLVKARNAIQFRKRKKLNKIMSLFLKHSKITNDEVEKLLHCSDATATRYLSILEKENRIKQNGKTGYMVFYSRQ